jgi:hypothetical protein
VVIKSGNKIPDNEEFLDTWFITIIEVKRDKGIANENSQIQPEKYIARSLQKTWASGCQPHGYLIGGEQAIKITLKNTDWKPPLRFEHRNFDTSKSGEGLRELLKELIELAHMYQ